MNVQHLAFGSTTEIVDPDIPPGSLGGAQAAPDRRAGGTGLPLVDAHRETLLANNIFGLEPLDLRARSFLLLRTQLMNQFHAAGCRALAITSTQPGSGKTFVTANVAAALSNIHPTVLLDLDLRRPSLAARFGLTMEHGVDDYLAGDAEWDEIGVHVGSPSLTIYGARKGRRDSAKLLSSERLGKAFRHLRALDTAPIVIVDTPPALVVDDIMLVAGHMDGILIVIEEGGTRAGELEEALRILAPCPIIGSVLNKSLTTERISRGYDYYDYPS